MTIVRRCLASLVVFCSLVSTSYLIPPSWLDEKILETTLPKQQDIYEFEEQNKQEKQKKSTTPTMSEGDEYYLACNPNSRLNYASKHFSNC